MLRYKIWEILFIEISFSSFFLLFSLNVYNHSVVTCYGHDGNTYQSRDEVVVPANAVCCALQTKGNSVERCIKFHIISFFLLLCDINDILSPFIISYSCCRTPSLICCTTSIQTMASNEGSYGLELAKCTQHSDGSSGVRFRDIIDVFKAKRTAGLDNITNHNSESLKCRDDTVALQVDALLGQRKNKWTTSFLLPQIGQQQAFGWDGADEEALDDIIAVDKAQGQKPNEISVEPGNPDDVNCDACSAKSFA